MVLRKENEVFGVDVALLTFFVSFAGLIKLSLQIRPCIVCRVVGRIWGITPAACQPVLFVGIGEFKHILLLSWRSMLIRVGIQTKDQPVAHQLFVRALSLLNMRH